MRYFMWKLFAHSFILIHTVMFESIVRCDALAERATKPF